MNEYWALLSQLGLWSWVMATLFFIHFSFPHSEKFVAKAAIKWGLISLCSFVFWVSGLLLA